MMSGAIHLVFFITALVFFSNALPDRGQQIEKEEYEDVPDRPFPGKIQIMPIVQRDTKHKPLSETVEEIIRELPNDEQYERIGKMLNNSYDLINQEVAEGKTAIRQKMVVTGERSERTNIAVHHAAIMTILINIIVVS